MASGNSAGEKHELAVLYPAPRTVVVAGRSVEIKRCGIAQAACGGGHQLDRIGCHLIVRAMLTDHAPRHHALPRVDRECRSVVFVPTQRRQRHGHRIRGQAAFQRRGVGGRTAILAWRSQ